MLTVQLQTVNNQSLGEVTVFIHEIAS